MDDKQRKVPANLLLIWFQFRSVYMILQSWPGKCWFRAHIAADPAAKEWWANQNIFDVPDVKKKRNDTTQAAETPCIN